MESTTETTSEFARKRVLAGHILKKIFLEDWAMKLVALAITFALWLGVTGLSEVGSDRYSVPLSIRVSENAEITNEPNPQVEIRVGGDKRRLGQIRERDLRVSIDLTELLPGDHVVNLTPQNVTTYDLPTGVKLEDIQPNKINVRLETVSTKELPVRVRTRGELADGFEMVAEPTVNPATVRVRGPESIVGKLTEISTEVVDIAERKAEFFERQVALTTGNAARIALVDSAVDIRFPIREVRTERVFLREVDGLDDRNATVILYGPRSVINAIKPEQLTVTATRNTNGSDAAQLTLPTELQNLVEVRQVRLRP